MMDLVDLCASLEPVQMPEGVAEDVCSLFERFAFEVRSSGFKHYTSDAILHRIRWHRRVERGDREFKCNDHWTAPLARWFVARLPHMRGFFSMRERRAA
jgi:hypothetical protein